jgi:hypothetical protein
MRNCLVELSLRSVTGTEPRAVVYNLSIPKFQNAFGAFRCVGVVRDHNHRAPVLVKLLEETDDLVAGLGIRLPVGSSARITFGSLAKYVSDKPVRLPFKGVSILR